MAVSLSASAPLYRNLRRAVILAALVAVAQAGWAQWEKKPKPDKGPRAVALLELAPDGKAHLIPVAIMVNGEFYDAGIYKASPVPMAIEPGTVYEAERSGVSLGLFTIQGALAGANNTWSGEGTWLPAGSKPVSTAHRAKDKPRDIDIDSEDKPPVLRRSSAEKPKPAEPAPSAPASSPKRQASTPASSAPASSAPASKPSSSMPSSSTPASSKPAARAPATESQTTAEREEEGYHPVLRRGKPTAPVPPDSVLLETHGVVASVIGEPASKSTKAAEPGVAEPSVQVIPAISDAGGPDPQPYVYPMKPEEEQQFRKKMLAMAADEIAARARRLAADTITSPPARSAPHQRTAKAAKAPQPVFDDAQLHVFDLASSNEPVLILTAKAHMPSGQGAGPAGVEYMITLVVRQDIYGDFLKAFTNVTDSQHLDVSPRYEFIDAVDADGDGRGELLFRKVSSSASAYTIFRVIGNQLWPLFDGRLGG